MDSSATTRWIVLADIAGLLALGIQLMVIFGWLVHDEQRLILGALAYLVLSGAALGTWHGKSLGDKAGVPKTWAVMAAGSVVFGGVFFCIDMIVGSLSNPGLSPVEAGTKAGSPFGLVLTLLVCPV